jgi:hypothetical protein
MSTPDLPRDALLTAARTARQHGPIPLIFASTPALYLLDNWLEHARRAGLSNTILIALDDTVAAHPCGPGCTTIHLPFTGDFNALWLLRLHVFELLANNNIDFIHSDIDAVWLGDIRPECYADPSLDLTFSQGLFFPLQAHAAWNFVLCCGLFSVRAGPASGQFLAAVKQRWETEKDDQIAVNLVLLDQHIAWQNNPAGSYTITRGDRTMTCYNHILRGVVPAQNLTIGLLPFHRVPRLPGPATNAIIRHPYSTRDPANRILALHQSGAWLGAG